MTFVEAREALEQLLSSGAFTLEEGEPDYAAAIEKAIEALKSLEG